MPYLPFPACGCSTASAHPTCLPHTSTCPPCLPTLHTHLTTHPAYLPALPLVTYPGDSDAYSYLTAKKRDCLREDDARELIRELLLALDYLHDQVG
jgi:hypothetical protein